MPNCASTVLFLMFVLKIDSIMETQWKVPAWDNVLIEYFGIIHDQALG